jgi:hypothetical protein
MCVKNRIELPLCVLKNCKEGLKYKEGRSGGKTHFSEATALFPTTKPYSKISNMISLSTGSAQFFNGGHPIQLKLAEWYPEGVYPDTQGYTYTHEQV